MGKNNIYLWTGTGAGKTTSALGVALRCLGHNKKVVIIQFMKGRKNIGEYKIRKKLGKNALHSINNNWTWKKQAQRLLSR